MRTRVKVCGVTRVEDALAAAESGADAVGLVFYAPSARAVGAEQAAAIVRALPPFVTAVGLFVDPTADDVRRALATAPLDLLQFHGDESAAFCAQFGRPYLKAVRVRPEVDLLEYARRYAGHPGAARGLLLDAYVEGQAGGTGRRFDWGLIPPSLPLPLVLSGGLDPDNVTEAVRRVRPWAVDVSSGVEAARGVKDAARVAAFLQGVRNASL